MALQPGARVGAAASAGVTELALVTDDAGDGMSSDAGNWAEARLTSLAACEMAHPAAAVDRALGAVGFTTDPTTPDEELSAFLKDRQKPVTLAADENGQVVVGFSWGVPQRIRTLSMIFAEGSAVPAASDIAVEGFRDGRWCDLPGILDPRSTEVTEMVDHMEDYQFLRSG